MARSLQYLVVIVCIYLHATIIIRGVDHIRFDVFTRDSRARRSQHGYS